MLSQIPECSEKAVKVLDERIMPANPQKMVTEKKKKEAFKKVVEGVIGVCRTAQMIIYKWIMHFFSNISDKIGYRQWKR